MAHTSLVGRDLGAMGDPPAPHAAVPSSCDPSISRVRVLLDIGAPSVDDTLGDEVRARREANPSGLRSVLAKLEAGPAGAVDDVEVLYLAGLPVGLPGGLHALALRKRDELLQRHLVRRLFFLQNG